MDEIVREFLVESQENLNKLDRDLVALEKGSGSKRLLSGIFRVVHSMKGSAGFLGYQKLGAVAHTGEHLLSQLRDGALAVSPPIVSGLLALVDAMREMLAAIEATGADGTKDYGALIERLQGLQALGPPETALAPQPLGQAPEESPAGATQNLAPSPALTESAPRGDETIQLAPKPAAKKAAARAVSPPPAPPPSPAPPRTPAPGPAPIQSPAAPSPETGPIPSAAGGGSSRIATPSTALETSDSAHRSAAPAVADSTIRVDIALLDRLMNLVGELVLGRNRLLQHTTGTPDAALLAISQRLNQITSELQEGMMKTRMQPIGGLWSKFPRMVRDLALECGKRVRVEIEGEQTELDRTVIEAIKDPITHLVRNAIDHGIEPPERRVVLGKSMEGTLTLRAYHESGQVNIEIKDDGAGIDSARIKRKAIERGLISAEEAEGLGERDLLNLIFLPGFSTAEQLTLVSGRGVGMDVVKAGIEQIGGTIDVQSRPGEGTAVKIKIPLTLAIIKALLVSSAGECYAIPQANLVELIRLDTPEERARIEPIQGAAVYRYRGGLLPLVGLGRVFEAKPQAGAAVAEELPLDTEVINIVVLHADEQRFGLLVDQVSDTQEIVVRPLVHQLKSIACFAGATILGDGRVALILDVSGLARAAGLAGAGRRRALLEVSAPVAIADEPTRALLIVQTTDRSRIAIPLEAVERLETLAHVAIEAVGKRPVVQYRGQILPLVDLGAALAQGQEGIGAPVLASGSGSDAVAFHMVVCAQSGCSAGLLCAQILDIAAEPGTTEPRPSRPGVHHTAVLAGRVTEVVDVEAILRGVALAYPELHEA